MKAHGGVLLTETAGKALLCEDGKVIGLKAIQVDGQEVTIACQAVILADGGFVGKADIFYDCA